MSSSHAAQESELSMGQLMPSWIQQFCTLPVVVEVGASQPTPGKTIYSLVGQRAMTVSTHVIKSEAVKLELKPMEIDPLPAIHSRFHHPISWPGYWHVDASCLAHKSSMPHLTPASTSLTQSCFRSAWILLWRDFEEPSGPGHFSRPALPHGSHFSSSVFCLRVVTRLAMRLSYDTSQSLASNSGGVAGNGTIACIDYSPRKRVGFHR